MPAKARILIPPALLGQKRRQTAILARKWRPTTGPAIKNDAANFVCAEPAAGH